MTTASGVAWLSVCLLAASGCGSRDLSEVERSPTAVAREKRLEKSLGDHNAALAGRPLARWVLPAALREISGLALTQDGRLLSQGDEMGEISEIDYRRGILAKHFFIGEKAVKGDFEGITVAGSSLFMLTSTGKLYQFREGANEKRVPYSMVETGLKSECEFEGLAFDPAINSLLFACKHIHEKNVHDAIIIFRWSLAGDSTARLSKLTVAVGDALRANNWKSLHPSDITIDPQTGNYVLVASLENALIEISPAGELLSARPLPGSHQQAEGVAITKDSILIVSDEAKEGPAVVTLYKWPLR
jgi:uncharacterized protein YjiK